MSHLNVHGDLKGLPSPLPNVKLPFWMSPWRRFTKADGTVEHRIDVARSRSDRMRHRITISVAQAEAEKLTPQERQKMFIERLKEALVLLGVVRGAPRGEEDQLAGRVPETAPDSATV